MKLWDLEGNLIQTLDEQSGGHTDGVYSVCFSPNGDRVATASADGTIKLWVRQGQNFKRQTESENQGAEVFRVCFNPFSSDNFVTISKDNIVKLWNLEGDEINEIKRFKIQDSKSFNIISFSENGISFSENGNKIAFADGAGRFIFWNWQWNSNRLFDRANEWVSDYRTNG